MTKISTARSRHKRHEYSACGADIAAGWAVFSMLDEYGQWDMSSLDRDQGVRGTKAAIDMP